jgi:hypothetical protein
MVHGYGEIEKKNLLAGRVDDKLRRRVDEMSLDCCCFDIRAFERLSKGEIVETAISFRLA